MQNKSCGFQNKYADYFVYDTEATFIERKDYHHWLLITLLSMLRHIEYDFYRFFQWPHKHNLAHRTKIDGRPQLLKRQLLTKTRFEKINSFYTGTLTHMLKKALAIDLLKTLVLDDKILISTKYHYCSFIYNQFLVIMLCFQQPINQKLFFLMFLYHIFISKVYNYCTFMYKYFLVFCHVMLLATFLLAEVNSEIGLAAVTQLHVLESIAFEENEHFLLPLRINDTNYLLYHRLSTFKVCSIQNSNNIRCIHIFSKNYFLKPLNMTTKVRVSNGHTHICSIISLFTTTRILTSRHCKAICHIIIISDIYML